MENNKKEIASNEESTKDKKRIASIVDLVHEVRDLLYNYNKECLNTFMTKVENILILELFLCEQNEFFMI